MLEALEKRAQQTDAVVRSVLGVQPTVEAIERTAAFKRRLEDSAAPAVAADQISREMLQREARLYERWARKDKQQHAAAAAEIVQILSADKVSWRSAEEWMRQQGSSIEAGMLAAIIEQAMQQALRKYALAGVHERKARAKTSERYALVLEIWGAKPSLSKMDLAFEITDRCSKRADKAKAAGDPDWEHWTWTISSIRRWLQGKTLDDVRRICATE